jgi:hypothetical protein
MSTFLSLQLTVLYSVEFVTMTCHFSGIFFVESFAGNILSCKAMDSEADDVVDVSIGYWFPKNEPRPFPKLYEIVTPGKVYEISGTYCIVKGQTTAMVLSMLSMNLTRR